MTSKSGLRYLARVRSNSLDHVEDGTIDDLEPGFDDVIADGLDEMAFSQSGRPHEQHIPALADELAGGQLIYLLPFDRRVESPVEVLQRFVVAETGGFLAFVDQPLMADVDFILEDQFQELFVGQLMDAGFLQAKFQAGEQAREAELAGVLNEVLFHGFWVRA